MSVPIVPVYVPRNKKLFHAYTIVIGVPYMVNPERKKLSQMDYSTAADELMGKINALKPASY
jgi:1-acyl-sn-glycerol-3-phosphate acyltransferase